MSQKSGISTLFVICGVIMLVIVGSIGFYLFFDTNNALSIPGLGTIGLNSTCSHKDPELCKFLNRAMKADYFQGSFSGTTSTTDPAGKIVKSMWEMDGKTKSRMVNYIDGSENFHMISIANTLYVKDFNDGKWWRQRQEISTENQQLPDNFDFEQYKKTAIEEVKTESMNSTYKQIGKEQCEKRICFQYEVISSDPTIRTGKEYIFFDDKDYILRKSRTEAEDGTITEVTYAYDAVSIHEPSPLKEAQPGQNIFMSVEQGGSSPNDELRYLEEFQQDLKNAEQNK